MAFSFYLSLLFINPIPSPSDVFNSTIIPFFATYVVFRVGPPIFKWIIENAPEPIQIKRREIKSLQSLRKLIRRGQEVIGLVVVLTFAIALGFASTTASATLYASAEDLANYKVGADIHFTSNYPNASFPLSEASNLRNTSGVATATAVKVIEVDIGTYESARLIGINASEYVEVSYSSTGLPLMDSPERHGLLHLQDNNQTVFISNYIVQGLRKSPGDEINIAYTPEDGGRRRKSITMIVSPTTAGLSGFSYPAFIIMDLGVLLDLINSSRVNHFLVNVENNANASIVAEEITSQYHVNFDSVEVSSELYKSWMGADLLRWLADTTTINFLYATIFSGLFFGVYVYTSFAKKKKEFTILRSIGLSQRQLVALSVFEISVFIFISILFGIGFGVLIAFSSNIANLMSLTGAAFFSRRLIFTPMSISISIILPLLSAISATLIVSINFARTNLPRMLKLDIEFVRAYRAEAK
jgi:predicted lysophospholipase L1 biosynthesis ABC-type transport system permease subunit